MNSAQPTQLAAEETHRLIQQMNGDHAEDVLLYAQIYGKQTTARKAQVIDLNPTGIDLEVHLGQGTPKRLNIRFRTPVGNITEAAQQLEHLTQRAHEIAGHNSREVVGRYISNYIRRWTG